MTPEELIRSHRVKPVREERLTPGGLNPTQGVEVDTRFQPLGGEEPPTLREDVLGDDAEGKRRVFRGRVLDTFGHPVAGALVEVDQGGSGAACVTTKVGTFSLVVAAPERQPEGGVEEALPPEPVAAPPANAPEAEKDDTDYAMTVRVSKGTQVLLTTRLYFRGCNVDDEWYCDTRLVTETGAVFAQKDLIVAC